MVQSSKRAARAPLSPIRKLVPLARQAEAEGAKVYYLNIGQPDVPTPEPMLRALASFSKPVVGYGPSEGDAAFRAFLLSSYRALGVGLRPSELVVTTGGSEALVFALAGCLDPGDEVVTLEPMYANYISFSSMLGVRLVPVRARPEDAYHLPDDFDSALSPRTRAILLCNPCNPTGVVYRPDEVRRLVDLAVERDLFLICDEVYREFVHDGPAVPSILTWPEIGERAVVVDSLSKRYSLCGARIGCIVSRNPEVMRAALAFAQARLSPPALAQVLAAAGPELPPDYLEGVRAEYRRRRDAVYEALRGIPGVVVQRPEGAFYQMAGLPVADAEDFVRFMLETFRHEGETVMVAPGAGFYATPGAGRSEVRIAFVLNEAALARAMQILELGLRAYRGG